MSKEEKIREICRFGEDRAHILVALARRKENEGLDKTKASRWVLKDEDGIEEGLRNLSAISERDDHDYRLYVSVNPRDVVSTYFNFLYNIQLWMKDKFYGQENIEQKFYNLASEWKGELHRPRNKTDTRFLIDYDENKDAIEFASELAEETEVVAKYETPNGWHIITEAFNYLNFDSSPEYEIKVDGDAFVGYL